LTFHFRWGDVKTNDYDHPNARALPMAVGVDLVNVIQNICNFSVKLMSEGQDVSGAFSTHFSGSFEYIDGLQAKNLTNFLRIFACSTALIGGDSSFTVLGALLSQRVVLAPKASIKYSSLEFVHDYKEILGGSKASARTGTHNEAMPKLEHALRAAAPSEHWCRR